MFAKCEVCLDHQMEDDMAYQVTIKKVRGANRTLIAVHCFKTEAAARDYARCYKSELGYTARVEKIAFSN